MSRPDSSRLTRSERAVAGSAVGEPALGERAVVDWLLDGDVAVQYQTTRDLLHRETPSLQGRITTEGHGAALLAARQPNGHWGRGFYQPKWTSTHYTLLELKGLTPSPDCAPARQAVALVLATEKGADGGLNPSATIEASDACVNGMALNYAAYFGAEQEDLASVVDFLLAQRLPDGGFNCAFNRRGAHHSSVHTSTSVLEGITEYARRGYRYRLGELLAARADVVEFLLRHRLYRSEHTGQPMDPEFTRLHHPARWHFDVLRGLDALADAAVPYDSRMDDAIGILESRRGHDGSWAANRPYAGATHVPPEAAGQPSRWVTLMAARVLAAYDPAALDHPAVPDEVRRRGT